LKTIVYVDGYNLFYSLLKNSNYKWLDLYKLFNEQILRPQNPNTELVCVKYYTANIKAKFSSHGTDASDAQQRYHRALESPKTGPVEIIKGFYSYEKSTPMRYKEPPEKSDKVAAWKLEEKQTDVNIALDIYRDAIRDNCEQVVICTSDTDIVPALKRVRMDMPSTKIGIVFPRPQKSPRPPSKTLAIQAHWVRNHITEHELASSVFTDRIPTNKKPVDKPSYW